MFGFCEAMRSECHRIDSKKSQKLFDGLKLDPDVSIIGLLIGPS